MPSTSSAGSWQSSVPLLAVAGSCAAEDQIGYDHESYVEDHGQLRSKPNRLVCIRRWRVAGNPTLRGVYDGISGCHADRRVPAIDQLTLAATENACSRSQRRDHRIQTIARRGLRRLPTPAFQSISRNTIPRANSHDIRRGIDVIAGITSGPQRFAPEFSYSKETDYISYAGALNYSIDLNDKNATAERRLVAFI